MDWNHKVVTLVNSKVRERNLYKQTKNTGLLDQLIENVKYALKIMIKLTTTLSVRNNGRLLVYYKEIFLNEVFVNNGF